VLKLRAQFPGSLHLPHDVALTDVTLKWR